jgi:hypothetical protein
LSAKKAYRDFFWNENIVSGVLSLAKPHRIKASHRRRWKGTTGHSVYIMNNPLSGTDPTGYAMANVDECSNAGTCAPDNAKTSSEAPTGSHIKSNVVVSGSKNGVTVSQTYDKGGKLVSQSISGKPNGASAQSDKSLAGGLAGDLLSNLQKEPLGANGQIVTKSVLGAGYAFPIDKVSVTTDAEGTQQIRGSFNIDGNASTSAVENLRSNLGNASGETSSGQKWVLSFTFQVVTEGGDVHMQWMTPGQLRALQRDYSAQYGSRVDSRQIVASTTMGSNTMLFNPLYKTVDSIAAGWGISRSDATQVHNYVKGSFAHEFSHGAGMGHTPNSSNSMTSYSSTRRVNGNDRARWCYLATESAGCLQ